MAQPQSCIAAAPGCHLHRCSCPSTYRPHGPRASSAGTETREQVVRALLGRARRVGARLEKRMVEGPATRYFTARRRIELAEKCRADRYTTHTAGSARVYHGCFCFGRTRVHWRSPNAGSNDSLHPDTTRSPLLRLWRLGNVSGSRSWTRSQRPASESRVDFTESSISWSDGRSSCCHCCFCGPFGRCPVQPVVFSPPANRN